MHVGEQLVVRSGDLCGVHMCESSTHVAQLS